MIRPVCKSGVGIREAVLATLCLALTASMSDAFLIPPGTLSLAGRALIRGQNDHRCGVRTKDRQHSGFSPVRVTGAVLGLHASSSDVGSHISDQEQVIVANAALVDGVMLPALVGVKRGHIFKVVPLSKEYAARIAADASGKAARMACGVQDAARVETLGENEVLVPAFVNGHTHLAMGALRGITGSSSFAGNVVEDLFFKLEVALEKADVRAFARMGCWESLLAGVGFCWEHYYFGDALVGAFLDTGMTGIIAPTLQDLSGPGLELPGCGPKDAIEDTLRIHRDPELAARGIGAALGPHATDTVSPELWANLAALAIKEGLSVHAHLAQSLEELERLDARSGGSPLRALSEAGLLSGPPCLLVHAMYVSQEDLRLLDPEKHVLGLCPASAVQFGFPCDFVAWQKAGHRVALGTDAACSNDNMNVQQELRLLAGGALFAVRDSPEHAAFAAAAPADAAASARVVNARRTALRGACEPFNDPATLLSSVTTTPGELHPSVRAGAIRPGMLANLLVLDTSHPALWPNHDPLRSLCFSDVSASIAGLLVAGKWVGERGNFQRSILQSKLYQEHRKEADSRFRALLKRTGLMPDA